MDGTVIRKEWYIAWPNSHDKDENLQFSWTLTLLRFPRIERKCERIKINTVVPKRKWNIFLLFFGVFSLEAKFILTFNENIVMEINESRPCDFIF